MTGPSREPSRPRPWLLWLYLAAAVVVTIHQGALLGRINNFLIFRGSFFNLLEGRDLYVPHPAQHWDLYKYNPSFALLSAPLALPPVLVGLLLWNLLNSVLLYAALDRLLPRRAARVAQALVFLEVFRSMQNSQSNGLVTALVVLAFVALERARHVAAALAIGVGFCVKLFPLAAASFAVFHPRRLRFTLSLAVVLAALAALPLWVVAPGELIAQYRSWFLLLQKDTVGPGLSVMGILHDWFRVDWPNWVVELAGTAALLTPLALRPDRWTEAGFRRLFLGSLLVYLTLFNHKAESPTYVVAFTGIAIWYAGSERTGLRDLLMLTAFLLVSVSSLNVIPSSARTRFVMDLKAVACLLPWILMQLELLERRERARVETAPAELPPSRGQDLALAGMAGATLLAVALSSHVHVPRRLEGPAPPKPAEEARRGRSSVAVIGFRNASGRPEAAWISTALTEMVSADLALGGKLRTIPGDAMARARADLALTDSDGLGKDALARIRRRLGADFVVLGSYQLAPKGADERVGLDLRLHDAATGDMVVGVADAGAESELAVLASRVAARLRENLGAGLPPGSIAAGSFPASPEGLRLYAEGLSRLRALDPLGAKDLLRKAVAADPANPLAHAALSAAWSALGHRAREKDEARAAFDRSASLSPEQRLALEARYRETAREWGAAIEAWRTLSEGSVDDPEPGLRLVEAQLAAGRAKDAVGTVGALRELPAPARDDPRIDLAEARAARALGDFRGELAKAVRAAEGATASGARLLAASARLEEAMALTSLGESAKAVASASEARRLFASAGDPTGQARSLSVIAAVRRLERNPSAARQALEEALALWRRSGDRAGLAASLDDLAELLAAVGDLAAARSGYEEALALQEETGDKTAARTLLGLADVLLAQGDPASARRSAREALGKLRKLDDTGAVVRSHVALGRALLAAGDFAAARARLEEALATAGIAGDARGAAGARLGLAELALAEGRVSAAETPAREAAEAFRREGWSENELRARAALARSLAGQGRKDEARREMDAVLTRAARAGVIAVQLEARLAQGEIELRHGDAATGRSRLQELALEARAKGFGLVARQAIAASKGPRVPQRRALRGG